MTEEPTVCFVCGSITLELDKHLLNKHGYKKLPIPKEGEIVDIYGNVRKQ